MALPHLLLVGGTGFEARTSHDADCCSGARDRLADAAGHHRLRLPDLIARVRPALHLRFLSHSDVAGERLEPRRVRARLCAAKPGVGHGAALCRRGGGPFRDAAGADSRRDPVRGWPRADGLHDLAGYVAGHRRRAGRPRPLGLLVQSGDCGVRQAPGRALPDDRDRRRHGRRFVRPVPVRAVRRGADRQRRLAAGACWSSPGCCS